MSVLPQVGRRALQVLVVVIAIELFTHLLGMHHLGAGWFILAGVLIAVLDPIQRKAP